MHSRNLKSAIQIFIDKNLFKQNQEVYPKYKKYRHMYTKDEFKIEKSTKNIIE